VNERLQPSFDLFPFYPCKDGTRGCYAADSFARVGSDCAVGYRGLLCGMCVDGSGRTAIGGLRGLLLELSVNPPGGQEDFFEPKY
jgi:hypothetical protein